MKWFPLVGGIIALLAGFYLFINPVTVVATLGWFIALFIFIYLYLWHFKFSTLLAS